MLGFRITSSRNACPVQAFSIQIPNIVRGSVIAPVPRSELYGGLPVQSDVCVREGGDRGAQRV